MANTADPHQIYVTPALGKNKCGSGSSGVINTNQNFKKGYKSYVKICFFYRNFNTFTVSWSL
jgi:hypothetical protein